MAVKIPLEIYPLFGMMSVAVGLAGYTGYKHLAFGQDIHLSASQNADPGNWQSRINRVETKERFANWSTRLSRCTLNPSDSTPPPTASKLWNQKDWRTFNPRLRLKAVGNGRTSSKKAKSKALSIDTSTRQSMELLYVPGLKLSQIQPGTIRNFYFKNLKLRTITTPHLNQNPLLHMARLIILICMNDVMAHTTTNIRNGSKVKQLQSIFQAFRRGKNLRQRSFICFQLFLRWAIVSTAQNTCNVLLDGVFDSSTRAGSCPVVSVKVKYMVML
ncbi:hypothetical protein BDR26DRAFT_1010775 [Obelidium mucronatum]|nr:hypothetical protein BDR26DRAFT_1010775 [Obelidium mucronatum]